MKPLEIPRKSPLFLAKITTSPGCARALAPPLRAPGVARVAANVAANVAARRKPSAAARPGQEMEHL